MNTDNSPMNLSQNQAKYLFSEGAILIIAGVPVGTEFGIDLCTYTVGERFRGIKMIPPGPHYVYCASQGLYGDAALRVGFLYYFKSNEIVIREWDNQNEELRQRQIENPELEKRSIRENLKELDKFLGPYDYRYITNWKNLTDCITESGILKYAPSCGGNIKTNIELLSCPDSDRPRGKTITKAASKMKSNSSFEEKDLLPDLKPIPGTIPNFAKIPLRIPDGCKASDKSKHYMDCIDAVKKLVDLFPDYERVIEEIQLSFVSFLAGYSVEALEHWRKLLNMLCNSETAIIKYRLLYMKYLEILHYQLPLLPEELMEPTEKNTVYKDIRNLLINATKGGIIRSAEKLSNHLAKTMKWNFHNLLDEDPEDLPVIVEI
ncbi:protein AAR2 homolog [Condylostylus longicornis]|uniref:protein AAR2 homolog n=1 Tax=Condylostylus longicornis TaxID=2530218 RepID=UPI00244E013D|nr:protein AAR2 homolog [Condylostylus longicornis]